LDVPISNRSILNPTTDDCNLFSTYTIQAYKELFESLNANADGYLNKSEIDRLFMRLKGSPSSDAFYSNLLTKYEDPKNHSKGLSMDGFLKLQVDLYRESHWSDIKVAQELLSLGFDRKLRFRVGRSVGVTIHGTLGHADPAIPRSEPSLTHQRQRAGIATTTPSNPALSTDSPEKIFKVASLSYNANLINAARYLLLMLMA
jgi:hypothetical protein